MSQSASPQHSQSAMWSMVLGIAAVPIGICAGRWGLAPLVLGGSALVLGVVALNGIRRSNRQQRGRLQAWTGIVLGALMCLVGVVIAVLTVVTDFFVWIAQIL